jgi:hypothetical protein
MTRQSIRIAWGLTGVCLVLGLGVGLALSVGPPEWTRSRRLQDVGAFLDLFALLFWMLVFGIYWESRRNRRD